MRRKLIAFSALAIALSAPGAFAAETVAAVDCGFHTLAEETVSGGSDTFTGVAYGYILSDAGENVTVRCEVRVDGGTTDSTDDGSGTIAAFTAGQVTFTAGETQDVDLCAVYTVNGGPETSVCGETSTTQYPPQEVIDLYDSIGVTAQPLGDLLVTVANSLIRCVTVVNTGTCSSGVCLVNTDWCNGGFCVVNLGYCGRGCIAVVNYGDCGVRVRPASGHNKIL